MTQFRKLFFALSKTLAMGLPLLGTLGFVGSNAHASVVSPEQAQNELRQVLPEGLYSSESLFHPFVSGSVNFGTMPGVLLTKGFVLAVTSSVSCSFYAEAGSALDQLLEIFDDGQTLELRVQKSDPSNLRNCSIFVTRDSLTVQDRLADGVTSMTLWSPQSCYNGRGIKIEPCRRMSYP